ncbi:hypothetical protein [Pedobacter alpinus]|uniref:Viral A-type inclusion protein n=1 Tax=Pedobacter alpinus TaxID=1590643 RepID=A0ABW5TTY4_9SPHI
MQLNKLYTALLAVTLLFSTSCNNEKEEQKEMQHKVMHTHDELMSQMGLLMENKNKIKVVLLKLDSLKNTNPDTDTTLVKNNLMAATKELEKADEDMMDWMHGFNPDYTGKKHEEVMEYLKEQEIKILVVEKTFKNVLIKSDSLINKYK